MRARRCWTSSSSAGITPIRKGSIPPRSSIGNGRSDRVAVELDGCGSAPRSRQVRAATAGPASQHLTTRWRICARMRRLIATGARPPSYPDICAAPREGPMDEMTKASAVPHRPERRGFDARFSGEADALFERHLRFDSVVDPAAAGARDKFEAAAHAVRDMLTQRWIQTQQTYDRENPKRVYYLSMEFLIGRSLTKNITNLMVEPVVQEAVRREGLDLMELAGQEP